MTRACGDETLEAKRWIRSMRQWAKPFEWDPDKWTARQGERRRLPVPKSRRSSKLCSTKRRWKTTGAACAR